VLAKKIGDSRALPQGAARITTAFSRLAQYRDENPNIRVEPSEGMADEDAGFEPAPNPDLSVNRPLPAGTRDGNAPSRTAEQE